jgi:regulator of RNase E activity RraA
MHLACYFIKKNECKFKINKSIKNKGILMAFYQSDDDLFNIIKEELFTAVIGDIMDKMDLRHQFLLPQIQPLALEMKVAGRAMTVLEADFYSDCVSGSANNLSAKPFGLMLEALDDLKRNEVYICSGASPTYALWGELMSTRAIALGAAGVVVNGYSRDTREILKLDFPTFSYGRYAQDQDPRGKVIDFRVPIEIGKVKIEPDDVIVGDMDGVCVVPKGVEEEVFSKAIEKARKEKIVQEKLQKGMSAVEAFEKYRIM